MKLINGQPFVNLEPYLDMSAFDNLEDRISYALAKNSDNFQTSSTTQDTLYDKTQTIFVNKVVAYKKDPALSELSEKQLEWYAKLNKGLTLGNHLTIRMKPGYPSTYVIKHIDRFTVESPWAADFDFVLDWVKNQKCFKEFGRVLFWVNESNQKTAWHRDYPDNNLDKRDPFIWLTGKNKKSLMLKDPNTGEDYISDSRALVFNSTNPHCSLGNELYTSWSLRIDGVFDKEWATRAGIAEYYNVK
jgi:hypothetical protein